MSALWIARARIRDMDGLRRYAEIVAGLEKAHPFEPLARSGKLEVLEGTQHFNRYFVHRFPSMEAARAFYYSPQYQEATAIRRASCDGCELVIMEGEDTFRGS
jgi:uncharacterized protein (DUF1330 family)